jgi:hypothetical protein
MGAAPFFSNHNTLEKTMAQTNMNKKDDATEFPLETAEASTDAAEVEMKSDIPEETPEQPASKNKASKVEALKATYKKEIKQIKKVIVHSLVNMHCLDGSMLTAGEECEISEDEHKRLVDIAKIPLFKE